MENFSFQESDIESREIVNIRCPDPLASIKMIEKIEEIKQQNDSIGGIITCVVRNMPEGLGEPVFDKVIFFNSTKNLLIS